MKPISYEKAIELFESGYKQPTPARGQYWYLVGRNTPILVALYLEPYIYTADISNKAPIEVSGPELGKIRFGPRFYNLEGGGKGFSNNVLFYAPFECEIEQSEMV